MRAILFLLLIAGVLAGCQKAARWDSADPVHCVAIFGIASVGAAAQSNNAVVTEMNDRILGLVQANGGAAWLQEITPETHRFAAEIEAADDDAAVLRLFDECAARHPPHG